MNKYIYYILAGMMIFCLSACNDNKAIDGQTMDQNALIQALPIASNENNKADKPSSLPNNAKEFRCELEGLRFSIGRSVSSDKTNGIESDGFGSLVLMATDIEDASNRVNDFLKRSGQLNGADNMNEGFIVKLCEPYTLSTLGAIIKDIPFDNYRALNEREDLALLYSISPENDKDKVAGIWSWKVKQEEDVFEHKKKVAATIPEIEQAIAYAKDNKAIVITTLGSTLSHFDLKNGLFNLELTLGNSGIISQDVLRESTVDGPTVKVVYKLDGQERFNFYKPKNEEEAAKLEKFAEQGLKVKIYAQAIAADSSKMIIKARIIAIRVYEHDVIKIMNGDKEEKLLFEIT